MDFRQNLVKKPQAASQRKNEPRRKNEELIGREKED